MKQGNFVAFHINLSKTIMDCTICGFAKRLFKQLMISIIITKHADKIAV